MYRDVHIMLTTSQTVKSQSCAVSGRRKLPRTSFLGGSLLNILRRLTFADGASVFGVAGRTQRLCAARRGSTRPARHEAFVAVT
ncbi:hypothetical protein E2C01_054394 [Portunus trituberculatus]|uniref:Uncharacterized protein n=1 Tax=Portunus trituberculatus TaxID=210409 RepID=A0A5B7GNJ9_PORTR|nr:hypothetical protein [Portunus trituberculatus]